MRSVHVQIDRLVLRFRGVPPERARAAAEGLGRQMLDQLARRGAGVRGGRPVSIASLHLETVTSRPSESPAHLSAAMAHAITGLVGARLPNGRGG